MFIEYMYVKCHYVLSKAIMEFIMTQKGGQFLLWGGYRFIVNRKMDKGTDAPSVHALQE